MQFLANANTTDQNQVVWLGCLTLDVWWWCFCSDLARFRPGRRNSSLFFLLQLNIIIILRRKRGASLVRLLSPVVCKLQRQNPFNDSRSIVICICIPPPITFNPPTHTSRLVPVLLLKLEICRNAFRLQNAFRVILLYVWIEACEWTRWGQGAG